ncbi:hypothetical protein ABZ464_02370 [Streptomyces sp. NPDC005820]|uniref:hypothetical protein n=1 Tax=Streptomyces sp. NPDC005820 TaxID=3157069 RepID=UPI003402F6CB
MPYARAARTVLPTLPPSVAAAPAVAPAAAPAATAGGRSAAPGAVLQDAVAVTAPGGRPLTVRMTVIVPGAARATRRTQARFVPWGAAGAPAVVRRRRRAAGARGAGTT